MKNKMKINLNNFNKKIVLLSHNKINYKKTENNLSRNKQI